MIPPYPGGPARSCLSLRVRLSMCPSSFYFSGRTQRFARRATGPRQVCNCSPGYMEQAPSRGHGASPQSGLGVGWEAAKAECTCAGAAHKQEVGARQRRRGPLAAPRRRGPGRASSGGGGGPWTRAPPRQLLSGKPSCFLLLPFAPSPRPLVASAMGKSLHSQPIRFSFLKELNIFRRWAYKQQ